MNEHEATIAAALSAIASFKHFIWGFSGAVTFLSGFIVIVIMNVNKKLTKVENHDTRIAVLEKANDDMAKLIADFKLDCRNRHNGNGKRK